MILFNIEMVLGIDQRLSHKILMSVTLSMEGQVFDTRSHNVA